MTAERWAFEPGTVEFVEHRGVPAMKIVDAQETVVLEDLTFEDGTIAFDVILSADVPFTSFFFRRRDQENGEVFYTRNYRMGDPSGFDAIQYTAGVEGVALWDLHPHYQAPAVLKADEWNRLKLVVSGERMRAYVNDMDRPALDVAKLESGVDRGGLAFQGEALFANLVVEPGATEDLPPTAGIDPAAHDPRYLRTWAVSEPAPLPPGRELVGASDQTVMADSLSGSRGLLFSEHWPSPEATWEPIEAERLGLVNLTRRFGGSEGRRVVWLKATLDAESDQTRHLDLGFSDEVWVLLNDQLVYADKNVYANPIQKAPRGRISVENASIALPLTAGANELLIGVANSFFGWGLIARLDSIEGITIEPADPS